MKRVGCFLFFTITAGMAPERIVSQDSLHAAPNQDKGVVLRCHLTYGAPFDVTIDLLEREVRFHGGPNIPIVESRRAAGSLRVSGSSGAYRLESALGPKPSVTFWEIGSTPQKADCARLTA